jgi:cation transport regulator ChaB
MPLLPYRRITELPERVQRHLPIDAQELYLQSYNNSLEKALSHAHRQQITSPGEASSESSTNTVLPIIFPSYSVNILRRPHTLSEYSNEEERVKAHCHRAAWIVVKQHYEKVLSSANPSIEPQNLTSSWDQNKNAVMEKSILPNEQTTAVDNTSTVPSETISLPLTVPSISLSSSTSVTTVGTDTYNFVQKPEWDTVRYSGVDEGNNNKNPSSLVWIKKYTESLSDDEETLPPLTASGGNL